jgi:hypothetical protein
MKNWKIELFHKITGNNRFHSNGFAATRPHIALIAAIAGLVAGRGHTLGPIAAAAGSRFAQFLADYLPGPFEALHTAVRRLRRSWGSHRGICLTTGWEK